MAGKEMSGVSGEVIVEATRARNVNFTPQDSLLLSHLMAPGEPHWDFPSLTVHQFVKHRFTTGITSESKKTTWKTVAEKFNASASFPRTAERLEKKWDNLCQTHRAIHSDYMRSVSLTGRGPVHNKSTLVTEAVMDVLGRDTVAVSGIEGATDTTHNQMVSMLSLSSSTDNSTASMYSSLSSETAVQVPSSSSINREKSNTSLTSGSSFQAHSGIHVIREKTDDRKRCSCQCHGELEELKKKKLRLQIQLFTKQLEKLNEE